VFKKESNLAADSSEEKVHFQVIHREKKLFEGEGLSTFQRPFKKYFPFKRAYTHEFVYQYTTACVGPNSFKLLKFPNLV